MRRNPIVLFATSTLTAGIAAQATWVDRTPATGNAPVRWTSAIAYDAARQRTVVFGGFGGGYQAANDTWEWDGSRWIDRTPKSGSPSARLYCRIAFDPVRKRSVLFGGWGAPQAQFDDTWEWDGVRWVDKTPQTGNPPGRMGHALVFDSGRGRLVLFGGVQGTSYGTRDDTWEWDGRMWKELPSFGFDGQPRAYHAMAYDAARQRVVMFGGSGPGGTTALGDTWEWDGTRWYDRTPKTDGPPPREHHGMVYDSTVGRVILFGGASPGGQKYFQDTWLWDGTRWIEVKPKTSPRPRRSSMTFDESRGVIVLFGGEVPAPGLLVADTWEFAFSDQIAAFQGFGAACGPAPQIRLAPTAGSRPFLGREFELTASHAPGNFAGLMTAGVSRGTPMALDAIGMKGCFLYHSLDAAWLFPIRSGVGQPRIPIPFDLGLIGAKFFVQCASGRFTSNGGEVTIGVR